MESWFKILLLILAAMVAYAAYWLALHLFSFHTVIIKNDSGSPITIEIYDLSWTVDADESTVKRFQSDKGDAHFTIRDAETRADIGGAGYLSKLSSECHHISITSVGELAYNVNYGSLCHLQNW